MCAFTHMFTVQTEYLNDTIALHTYMHVCYEWIESDRPRRMSTITMGFETERNIGGMQWWTLVGMGELLPLWWPQ